MAQSIALKLVVELGGGSELYNSVSDVDVFHPWPGDPVTLDISNPPQLVQPVWVATNADGTAGQVYPADMPVADILAEGWVHLYQGTEIVDSEGNVNVYSNQYNHVLLAMAACCSTSFATQALALKESDYPLTPGETYPCQAEAIFKWLAIRGSQESRPNLAYSFNISMANEDSSIILADTEIAAGALSATTQLALSWPEDFVGLIIDGVTLVANDTVPLTGQRQVKDFDGGVVGVTVSIQDLDVPEQVSGAGEAFALPDTDCEPAESGFFEDQFETQFE